MKKGTPAKTVTAVTQAEPAEQAASAEQAAQAAPAKKAAPAKRAVPAKKPERPPIAPPAPRSATSARPAGPTVTPPPAAAARPAVRADEKPWSKAELAEVRQELNDEIKRLEIEMGVIQGSITDLLRDSGDGAGDDQADSGGKAFEREQEMTLLANARESMLQSQHALTRIEEGAYGSCESCGNPIGKLRLQAFPRATLCVSCKQQQERR